MMLTGKVVRFDETRGYGFIAPDTGGDDVFIHANMLDGDKWSLAPGVAVEYEAVESDRGPKALVARIVGASTGESLGPGELPAAVRDDAVRDDAEDGLCDVLSESTLLTETTEALLRAVPDLTAAQVVQVRRQVLSLAQRHGWVEG